MTLNRTAPPFHFAVTETVTKNCPVTVDGVDLMPRSWVPSRARPKDTGYDVRCAAPNGVILTPGAYIKIPLGIRMFAPDGWWLSLVPRSGTFINRHVHALYGVIDETYENELCFVGQYFPDAGKMLAANVNPIIKFGERIAQVLPVPRWESEMIEDSNEQLNTHFAHRNDVRGTGGFGSSGSV